MRSRGRRKAGRGTSMLFPVHPSICRDTHGSRPRSSSIISRQSKRCVMPEVQPFTRSTRGCSTSVDRNEVICAVIDERSDNIDVTPALEMLSAATVAEFFLPYGEGHLSLRGHEHVVERICECLREGGILSGACAAKNRLGPLSIQPLTSSVQPAMAAGTPVVYHRPVPAPRARAGRVRCGAATLRTSHCTRRNEIRGRRC
jgi:hypothetical protein